MNKFILFGLAAIALQGCVVHPPIVSSNVIEADKTKGNLMSITAENCGVICDSLALNKAQEVCPSGYVIQNTARNYYNVTNLNMIVRCQPVREQQGS